MKVDKNPLPIPGSSAADTGVQVDPGLPEFSAFESLGATIIDTAYDGFTSAAQRTLEALEMGADTSDKMLSVEELHARYPDLKEEFASPTREALATTIAERKRFRNTLKEVAENGPDNAAFAATRFGVGLLTGFVDPIAIAAGVGIAGGIAHAGKNIPNVAKIFGNTATGLGRARLAATEGFIGAAVEQPAVLGAAALDQSDYSIDDVLINLAAAPIFGAAISGLATGVGKLAGMNRNRLAKKNPDVIQEKATLISHQIDEGMTVNAKHLDEFAATRTSNPGFTYTKFAPVNYKTTSFYVPSKIMSNEFRAEGLSAVLDDFGDAIYMTDDFSVANAHSYDGGQATGSVFEAKFKHEPKVLDLDSPATGDDLLALQAAKVKNPETKSIKQALREVESRENLNILLEEFSTRYDAATHSGGESNGFRHSESNVMVVLRPDSLEVKPHGPTDTTKLKSFGDGTDQTTARILTESKDPFIDDSAYNEFINRENLDVADPKLTEMDADIKLLDEQLQDAELSGYLSKEEIDAVKTPDLEEKRMDIHKSIFKMLIGCVN